MPATPEAPSSLHAPILDWFATHGRELPWRDCGDPWAVLVSEFMLQQTPVARVLSVFEAWMDRWPTPADCAAADRAAILRAWGRLGYPRRALRLHEAARVITTEHGGTVPDTLDALLALPGVGDYTAAAVVSFAFGGRAVVLDTNVRRVFARAVTGHALASGSPTRAERELAAALVPRVEPARWAAATMELGALVCTARSPDCEACPIRDRCAWWAAGRPAPDGVPRRAQAWAGTDRQCRGRLMALVRDAAGPLEPAALADTWPDDDQRERCLDSLLDDGLLSLGSGGLIHLGH